MDWEMSLYHYSGLQMFLVTSAARPHLLFIFVRRLLLLETSKSKLYERCDELHEVTASDDGWWSGADSHGRQQ